MRGKMRGREARARGERREAHLVDNVEVAWGGELGRREDGGAEVGSDKDDHLPLHSLKEIHLRKRE